MTRRTARAGGRRLRPEPLVLLTPGLAFLLVLVAVPMALVLAYTVASRGRFGGVEWSFTLDSFSRVLEPVYLRVFADSLLLAGAATLITLLIGYPTAYAITRLPARWRPIALVAVVVPFWTNFLIRVYAWIVLLNTQGVVNDVLTGVGIVDEPLNLLYTKGAVVAGLVYAYLPLMVLPIYASLERVDRELLEAASNLGASRTRAFWSVTLPLSLPGVLTGAILVFVPSLGNFVVPDLLGGGKTVMIGNVVRDQFLEARDWPFGSVLALVLVVVLLVLFLLQALVNRRVEGGGRRA